MRSMAVIGVLVIGGIGYAFFGAAPVMTAAEYHKESTPVAECLDCHVRQADQNPIMPHRPADGCTFCHNPAG